MARPTTARFKIGILAFLLSLGFASGARVAIGTQGLIDLTASADSNPGASTAIHQRDPVQGDFWAPTGSSARRVAPSSQPALWVPRGGIEPSSVANLNVRRWQPARIQMAAR